MYNSEKEYNFFYGTKSSMFLQLLIVDIKHKNISTNCKILIVKGVNSFANNIHEARHLTEVS